MHNIMIDLETLSSAPNAAIVSIGAVTFADNNKDTPKLSFYQAVDPESAQNYGQIDAGTFVWWMKQSDEARSVFADNGVSYRDALTGFSEFCAQFDEVRIWGNGSDFDNVILQIAYDQVGIKPPWRYSNNRCYRTLKGLRPDIPFERCGVAHNALADAISQAFHAEKIISALGGVQ